ncbi:MAG: hypothetical protein QHH01_03885 [Spirochaetales bacterium]|nr:hypothetical protein [Spirochaetales bacterium]
MMHSASPRKHLALLPASVLMFLAAAFLMLTGCDLLGNLFGEMEQRASVFAIDSRNGNIYEIDAVTKTAAAVPLVSTLQNATGDMIIRGSRAFLAVGNWANDKPGLYWVDLSSPTPSARRVGEGISAQYVWITATGKGFVTSADYVGVYSNAVYTFDPQHPGSGLGEAVSGFDAYFFPQDVVSAGMGSEERVFVADNGNGKVYRLNAAGTAVEASFSTSAGGTTGLLPGSYDSNGDGIAEPGVFVANNGGWDAAWNPLPGSIDFIPCSHPDGVPAIVVEPGFSASRLAAFDAQHLIAVSYNVTSIINLSVPQGDPARITTVKYEGHSFGASDVNVRDDIAYVPDGATAVYSFGLNGEVHRIPVGTAGAMITNVAIRE